MKYIFLCVKCCNFDLNFTEHSPRGPVNNKPVLVGQTMAWHHYLNFLNNSHDSGSVYWQIQGAVSIRKTVLPGMVIPMLKIRRPNGRLIFNMDIALRR